MKFEQYLDEATWGSADKLRNILKGEAFRVNKDVRVSHEGSDQYTVQFKGKVKNIKGNENMLKYVHSLLGVPTNQWKVMKEGEDMSMGAWKMPDGKVYSANKKKRDKDGYPTTLSWGGKVFPVKNHKVVLPTGEYDITEAIGEGTTKLKDFLVEDVSVRSLTAHMPQDFMSKKFLKGPVRSKMNKEIQILLKPTYFDSIPLKDIFKILEKHGTVPLQEDATYWSGFLTGGVKKTEQVYFNLGWKDFKDTGLEAGEGRVKYPNQHGQYMVIPKAVLSLSYFKMPSGRYEVIAYVS